MVSIEKVRWGVLGVARIALHKVIPALQRGNWCNVHAIASRSPEKAQQAAAALGIPKAYGSYEALLADSEIDAIYNPLPNHLHVPWTTRAAEAGKHVLCEKPIARSAEEALPLLAVRERTGVQIQEAFMVRTHPQWLDALERARSGQIGDIRSISGFFSYFNDDPANVRNIRDIGGGALLDIGCYLVNTARFVFGREPARVAAALERDPRFDVDTLTSVLLDFAPGHAIGTCGTQLVPHQRVEIFGTRGRIEITIPFNAPPDRPCRIYLDDGSDLFGAGRQEISIETCNQYTIQGDLFSQAIRGVAPLPYPLEDTIANLRVIDAVFKAAETGRWESVET